MDKEVLNDFWDFFLMFARVITTSFIFVLPFTIHYTFKIDIISGISDIILWVVSMLLLYLIQKQLK